MRLKRKVPPSPELRAAFRVLLPPEDQCPNCNGEGWIEYASIPGHECPRCRGSGTVSDENCGGNGE